MTQIITPTKTFTLSAETRADMDDWLAALKTTTSSTAPGGAGAVRELYELDSAAGDPHDFLSNHHRWYATSHARPTYCNVCRDTLTGVTSHGLSCEVCKCKVHKRCAAKAIANCKWTTLATVGHEIIEEEDGVSAIECSAKCIASQRS